MEKTTELNRPSFDDALAAWKALLAPRGLPTDLLWVFDENLCFEKDPARPGGFRLGIQTALTPPPPEAERIAYEHFSEFTAPLVFYRLGSCRGKSVCLLLCDPWFAGRGAADGFEARPEWQISFRPGSVEELEEIQDAQRWQGRILRDRPLHDLDFCMSLRAIHETLAHGRVLTAYEHYALKFLHAWGRFLGRPD